MKSEENRIFKRNLVSKACELEEKCVPFYLCKPDKKIVSDGASLIDERFDADPPPSILTCPSVEKCCAREETVDNVDEIENRCELFATPEKCGLRNVNGLGGHVEGVQNKTLYANYAEFPWMVAGE